MAWSCTAHPRQWLRRMRTVHQQRGPRSWTGNCWPRPPTAKRPDDTTEHGATGRVAAVHGTGRMQVMTPTRRGEPLPERLAPMLATLGTLPPQREDEAWAYEMKWDGVRTLARGDGTVNGGRARRLSRNDLDMALSYPELAALGPALDKRRVLLVGEIVCINTQGRPRFRRLQKRMHVSDAAAAARLAASDPVVLLVFDLLHLDGQSLLNVPYAERREQLESPRLGRGGVANAAAVRRQQRRGGPGQQGAAPGRRRRQTPDLPLHAGAALAGLGESQEPAHPGGRHRRLDARQRAPGRDNRRALLPGIPDGDALAYLGKVGTGFTEAMLRDLAHDLEPFARDSSPLRELPRVDSRDARWVAPQVVGEAVFSEWTGGGRLRHPAWSGTRPDKTATEVVRES